MPMEVRGKCNYFYKPKRVDGKPTRVYQGSGLIAELQALRAELDAERKREQEERDRLAIQALKDEEEPTDAIFDEMRLAIDGALAAAGYRRTKSGRNWRRPGAAGRPRKAREGGQVGG